MADFPEHAVYDVSEMLKYSALECINTCKSDLKSIYIFFKLFYTIFFVSIFIFK